MSHMKRTLFFCVIILRWSCEICANSSISVHEFGHILKAHRCVFPVN